MNGEARDPRRDLEDQLEAAGLLIESLEQEVANLRHELAQARVALRAAREEMAARERTLEEAGRVPADEVRRIKSIAETRERELRRAFSKRVRELEENFQKRLDTLAEQREADRRALLDRLAAQRERDQREISALQEHLEGMNLRREAEMHAYSERLRQLKEENLGLQRALEEKTRNEDPGGRTFGAKTQPLRKADASVNVTRAEDHVPEKSAPVPRNPSAPTHSLRFAVEKFNASEHTLAGAAMIKSFGLPEVRVEQEEEDGSVEITISWGDLGWKRYTCNLTSQDPAEVRLTAEGDDPIEITPNARLDLEGRIMLGARAI